MAASLALRCCSAKSVRNDAGFGHALAARSDPYRRGAARKAQFARLGRADAGAPGATVECTVNWVPGLGMGFVAETGSGHLLTMDGAPDGGGRDLAPRPLETMLAGAGGCTAYDIVLILQRGRHDVRGCQVRLSAERAPTEPKVFTRIHMHYIVSGRDLPATAVERAVALSHERYCSASIMLGKTATITSSHEVVAD